MEKNVTCPKNQYVKYRFKTLDTEPVNDFIVLEYGNFVRSKFFFTRMLNTKVFFFYFTDISGNLTSNKLYESWTETNSNHMKLTFVTDDSQTRSGFEIQTGCSRTRKDVLESQSQNTIFSNSDVYQCDEDFELVNLAEKMKCILYLKGKNTQEKTINKCTKHGAELPVPLKNEENHALRTILDKQSLKRKP